MKAALFHLRKFIGDEVVETIIGHGLKKDTLYANEFFGKKEAGIAKGIVRDVRGDLN